MSGYERFKKKYPRAHRAIQIGKTVASVAGQALSIASAVAGVINAEHKHVDTIFNAGIDNSTGAITCLTNMAQGTTDQTRTGNSVLAKHLYLKGELIRNSAAAAAVNETIRFMVIMDTNNEADVAPTIPQILQNYSTAYCGVSMHNKEYTDRFKVLMDKTYQLGLYEAVRKFKLYKVFKVKQYTTGKGRAKIVATHMTYNGALSSDLAKNHIYVIAISSVNTNTPTLRWHARFGYVDN